VFATRNARPNRTDNIRTSIIAPVKAKANALLGARGAPAIGHLTPHTLRRTFASQLAEIGLPPRRCMYLLGHSDPTMTMAVYQQVLDVADGAVSTLEQLLGASLDELFVVLSGRAARDPENGDWPMIGQYRRKTPSEGDAE
jgi:integrase